MATVSPFLRRGVHNLRILWTPTAAAVTSLRGGVPLSEQSVVIDAYAEATGRQEVDAQGVRAGSLKVKGFLCRWALLPEDASWLESGSGWTWDTTGLRPLGLLPGADGLAFWGAISSLPATTDGEQGRARILELGGAYGAGGIGERMRRRAGDEFEAVFATAV